ncbi:hypothetical protein ONA91_10525 [Micromonospora sp. DR5-3]|uniref:hypothetical protein n=1 Tax=unclassified Micromonospora TaxID=2617518 RepID=UPI0011D72B8D|nr:MULTISPECIES: hypothetical protein [unclassified Micromonospora]MCW3814888.1 hypothetical protein [Micromonospora sp. DR5-3]TYC24196.1 hypothetical protein FXF52_12020 [Micromonospora sp. MP36]
MSRELTRLYRALAADTDPRALPDPDQVRRRADRRARNRATLGALTAAVLVAGTAVGARLVLAAGPDVPPGPPAATPTAGASTPPASGTPSPSRSAATPSRTPAAPRTSARPPATTPTSIPDRAFFALPAANDAGTGSQFVPGPVLPALCGATPGEAQVVTRRARTLAVKLAGAAADAVPDGSYRQSVTVYRAGRADDALRELSQAVRGCPEQPLADAPGVTVTQRLLDGARYGDESVLFETRTPYRDVNGAPTGGDEVHLIRAVRIGDVVTVLWEQGWEGTSTDRSQFEADSRRATEAVRRWLG